MTFTDDNQIWQPDQMPDNRQVLQHLDQNPGAVIKQPVIKKPLKPATRKEKEFARRIATNPSETLTEAYKAVYNTKGHKPTVQAEASRTASKPQVKLELAKYNDEAKNTILTVMKVSTEYAKEGGRDGAAYAGHALSAANSVIDRVDGKAIIRQQIETRAVTLNIDLTSTIPEEAA